MRITVQLVVESAGTPPQTVDVSTLLRKEFDSDSLGLHISEAKALLETLQKTMVASRIDELMLQASRCARCGADIARKGHHDVRTVFGKLRITSPRLYRCKACSETPWASFSPLAQRLPDRSSYELQYLQTKFAALMS